MEPAKLIQLRADSILADHPDWPCRKGCSTCCRHLADVPQLNRTEWEALREELTPELVERIRGMNRIRPIVCPLLDHESGACLVYEARPLACRAYGFYMERDKGLYCSIIEARPDVSEVVWGNYASIELGETRDLLTWVEQEGRWPRP